MSDVRLPTPRPVPRVVIILKIEQSPIVLVDANTPDDFARLDDWIKPRPDLHQLIIDALAIRERRGVA